MAGIDNLIPGGGPTSAEARENGRKGGIASGVSRRRAKSMRQWAKALAKEGMHFTTPEGKEIDGDIAGGIVIAQMRKAAKGDTKAAKFVADLLGEATQDAAAAGVSITISTQSKEDAESVAAILAGGRKG